MESWEDWIQDVGKTVIGAAADAKYTQPYEVQKLRLQALGEAGIYDEGQAGAYRQAGGIAGMSPSTLLLIGGAVLLVVLLKD